MSDAKKKPPITELSKVLEESIEREVRKRKKREMTSSEIQQKTDFQKMEAAKLLLDTVLGPLKPFHKEILDKVQQPVDWTFPYNMGDVSVPLKFPSIGDDIIRVKSDGTVESKPNPDWVNAPYELKFPSMVPLSSNIPESQLEHEFQTALKVIYLLVNKLGGDQLVNVFEVPPDFKLYVESYVTQKIDSTYNNGTIRLSTNKPPSIEPPPPDDKGMPTPYK